LTGEIQRERQEADSRQEGRRAEEEEAAAD